MNSTQIQTRQIKQSRRPARLALVAVTVALAGLLTGTAYTQESASQVAFVCEGGDRFTVEFHSEHVRLRNGAGVFSLGREPGDTRSRYSDGDNVFWTDGTRAGFENVRLQRQHDCRPGRREA